VELTEIQKKTVELTDFNVVVSAGAGTGKTAVLVARFINLVRSGLAEVNQILTITFTEKAAEEMKQRIAEGFRRLRMRKEKTTVETAYISTIHSFCSRLIRENPFAAGVDPEFEVLDEMDRQLMLGELFDELFSEGEEDFLELAEHYGDNAVSRAIISYMDLCRSLGRGVEYVENLLAEPNLLTRKAEALAEKRAARAMQEIAEAFRALSSLEATGKLEERRRQMLSLRDSLSDVASFRQAAETMASLAARLPPVEKKASTPAASVEVREKLSLIGTILKEDQAEIFFDRETEEKLLPCKLALLKGVILFWRNYEARKRERGVLDYEDLQLIARGLLRDDPALRKDYANRFRFVLVDEFQDINWLQKELIELLSSERNLFVVGDGCQSIYGFRNADVEIFVSLLGKCDASPQTHRSFYLGQNFRSGENLIRFYNFFFSRLWAEEGAGFHLLEHARKGTTEPTAPSVEIMLFQQRRNEGEAPEELQQVRQREAKAVAARIAESVGQGAMTVFDSAMGATRPLRYGDVAILCRTRSSYPAYTEAFSQLGIPFCTVGGESFYDKQEVADLINLLTIIDNPLRDIPLVAVLRSPFVGVSDDTLFLLAEVIRSVGTTGSSSSPVGGRESPDGSPATAGDTNDHFLFAVRKASSIPGIADDDRRRLEQFSTLLEKLRRRKDSMPLHGLLKTALEASPCQTRVLASRDGIQKAANISKFLDVLREYDIRRGGGISGFLRFYETIRYYGPREQEAPLESFSGDVVKLMTIHAAKGLEFPVVVVADMSRRFNFDRDRFLPSGEMEVACNPWEESAPASCGRRMVFDERKEKQLGEETRLLYVAATRARDHLVLAGICPAEGECEVDSATSPMDWLMAVVGKETPLPETGDSCEVRLGEATARILVDPPPEQAAPTTPRTSLLQRYFDRIAAGESIPVPHTIAEKFLPEVRKVLERTDFYARGGSYEPSGLPAEISVSQLMLFDECPHKFFLREVAKFPEREVMVELGLCPAGGEGNEDRLPTDEIEPLRGGRFEIPSGLARRRFGELVHQCLEQLDFRAGEKQNIRAIAERFFSSSEEVRIAEELIRSFLRSADGERLSRAREVQREVPVKAAVQGVIVSGVIDVLCLDEENHWTILDFKTGSRPAEDTPDSTRYDFQMLLYAFLLSRAMGGVPQKATVHFLRSGTSRSVSTRAADVEQAEKRAAEIIAAIGRREFRKAMGANCQQCEYTGFCSR